MGHGVRIILHCIQNHYIHAYVSSAWVVLIQEQTSGNKLKENDKVGKGNYVTFEETKTFQ
jgi:hypothetical protein